nr:MAG TPA: hypothetical protein [Caudoviricetes sp.]
MEINQNPRSGLNKKINYRKEVYPFHSCVNKV